MILVWFLDLKFLKELAAKLVGLQTHHTRYIGRFEGPFRKTTM
jgi:hypothetical protein